VNALDLLVAWVAPQAGLRRRHAREVLASYEAAKPSRLRKFRRDTQSPNQLVEAAALPLRAQGRYLQRNHDVARGILRTLVNNIVGPVGIGIEPQPRRADGSVHEVYASALRAAWRDWQRNPEVTHCHHWARAQRLAVGAWMRDGEAFAQYLIGSVPFLDHGTRVPLSLELFEADMVPIDYEGERIRQGVERNAWGRPVAYFVYKAHPLDTMALVRASDLKRIPAERMLHLAALDRLGQIRGVSEFASVITRLEDIKDYEESERIAAKIAAALTAFVRKGSPDMFDPATVERDADGKALPREISLAPGTIIDGLAVGEEIGMVDSKRPNPNVVTFRQGQLRAVAAGVGASYSSISRDYNGTYSAQRQELVEQWVHYATLTDEFVGQFIQPVWETFVATAHLSGVVRRPGDVAEDVADDALYVGQSMPWIDPLKEALGWESLVKAGFASEVEVIRRRGGNPYDVLAQLAEFRRRAAELGLTLSSNAASAAPAASPEPAEDDDAGDDDEDASDRAARDYEGRALASLAEGMAAIAARETPAPTVNVAGPVINMPEQAPPVVNVAGTTVNVPEQAPPVVNVEAAPAQVVMQHPKRAVQTFERDPDTLELTRGITDYE
jgi:lambda family phage portal protein